ncbi:MAG: phosphate/phosphite/phosphonate ABC transporter substrate-binding protein [Ardenticatenales bacterium]|nr:phosphate/phosphite/phosphonate ABC transporter substrate-binding protein [Ardenticatenales bacterium]
MRRNTFALVAMLLLILSLAACTGATPAATPPPAATAAETMATPEMMATSEMMETPEMMEGGDLGTEENPIIMSFVPSGDTQEIIASGEEIAAMIQEKTGLVIEANVATSYAAVVEAMGAGNAQVGWLNTFSYILAAEKYNVEADLATVRRGSAFYTGQIVANADSGIETLADIDGKKMCWVDPLSTSGYIIPRVMLAAAGVDVDALETQDSGSHPNVITAVYNGDCDAGASFVDARTAIAEEFPDVNDKVKVVAVSPEIPNDSVSFAPDLPAEAREQIVAALLEIAQEEEGMAALAAVYEVDGFQEIDDSFYDGFRTELDAAGIDIEELAK